MAREIIVHDLLPLTQRTLTGEGYLVAPAVLSRAGIQRYYAYELGLDKHGVDSMRIIHLYRPPEEVFDPDSLSSFKSLPITSDHPPGNVVDSETWRKYAVGDCQGGVRSGDAHAGTVTVRDAKAVKAVMDGKTELSCGYTFVLDLTAGVDPVSGAPYDGIQRRIRGNHVAIVDAGRCGPACRIADSSPTPPGETPVADKDATRKIIVDGVPIEVGDTAAAVVEKLIKERDEAKVTTDAALKDKAYAEKALADAKKAHEEAVTQLAADHATAIEALKKDVITPEQRDVMVRDWAEMLADAKRLAPTVATDGKTCVEVRRAVIKDVAARHSTANGVITAILAGKPLDAADADTVRAAFNAIKALPVAHEDRADPFTRSLAGANVGDGLPVMDARTLFHHNMARAFAAEH